MSKSDDLFKDGPPMEVPNLDGFSLEELREFGLVCEQLANYCKYRYMGSSERVNGRINSAVECECVADKTYQKLPKWAKW